MDFFKICFGRRSVSISQSVTTSSSPKSISTKKLGHESRDLMSSMKVEDASRLRQKTKEKTSRGFSKWYKTIRKCLKRKVGRRSTSTSQAMDLSAGREKSIEKYLVVKPTDRTSNVVTVFTQTILDEAIAARKPRPVSYDNPDYILALLKREVQLLEKKMQHLQEYTSLVFKKAEQHFLISERSFEIWKDANADQVLSKAVVRPQPQNPTIAAGIPLVMYNEPKMKAKKALFKEEKEKSVVEEEELKQREKEILWEEFISGKVSEVGFFKIMEIEKENQMPFEAENDFKQNITDLSKTLLQEINVKDVMGLEKNLDEPELKLTSL